MLKAFDWSPWIKAITIKLYYCTSSFNWWFKFRFIWSQRNCCIYYFHFPPLQNHHSNRNMCQHCTMLILNPQDLKSCWWITWRPSFECSSYHTGDNLIVITIIIECPPTVQREEGGRQRYNSCWDSGTLFVYLASIFVFTFFVTRTSFGM